MIAAEAAHGPTPLRLLATNVTVQPEYLGCCAPQSGLLLGHGGASVSLGRTYVMRIVARNVASGVARNNARVDPV